VKLLHKGLISSVGKSALLVQHGKNSHFLFEQIQTSLIVLERDGLPLNVLSLVLFLLLLENERVELLLKLFVGIVLFRIFRSTKKKKKTKQNKTKQNKTKQNKTNLTDAHLLKRILLKVFEAENVQYSNEDRIRWNRSRSHDGSVDAFDEPTELIAIPEHAKKVSIQDQRALFLSYSALAMASLASEA
jgi:Ca2+/Na+ antiporter